MKGDLIDAHKWVKNELEKTIVFWLENGLDKEYGGVITCLDRKGQIFSKDKSVWMQGRCGWVFANLCTVYGKKQEWIESSKLCIDFLEKYCHNKKCEGRLYFTVTNDGKPLRQRRYCHSENFYTMANAEYFYNTGDKVALEHARWSYELVWKLNHALITDPVGIPPKQEEIRRSRSHGDPMIYLNVSDIMRRCDPERKELYDFRAKKCVEEIVGYFFKPELKCTLETVGVNGELQIDTVAGRVINPGHDIECSWFLLNEALYENNAELICTAETIFKNAIEAGWDDTYGGILYFIDALGYPPEAYEHDMKLWWPHTEALIASMMFYKHTSNDYYLKWFFKILDYVQKHFVDSEYGEWYGYLRRDGLPTEPPCKGSTFKGPFHVPRCLIILDQLMTELENAQLLENIGGNAL